MKPQLNIIVGAFAAIGVVSTGAMLSSAAFAQGHDKEGSEQLGPMTAPVCKVTPVQAMVAAQGKVGGKAVMAIFEFDEGKWVYGVVVTKGRKLFEVDVDPLSGKAGDFEAVSPADEGKEFQESLKKLVKAPS